MGDRIKIPLAKKGFSGKHYLEFSCYAEGIDMGKYTHYVDLVFAEFSIDYSRSPEKKIAMQLGSIDLRALHYAIKECIKTGNSSYIKYTDPKLAGSGGARKELNVKHQGGTKGAMIYINMSDGVKSGAFGLDAYSAASMADALSLLAEEAERGVYRCQRAGATHSFEQ